MNNKDLNLLKEAYSKIYLKEEELPTDTTPDSEDVTDDFENESAEDLTNEMESEPSEEMTQESVEENDCPCGENTKEDCTCDEKIESLRKMEDDIEKLKELLKK